MSIELNSATFLPMFQKRYCRRKQLHHHVCCTYFLLALLLILVLVAFTSCTIVNASSFHSFISHITSHEEHDVVNTQKVQYSNDFIRPNSTSSVIAAENAEDYAVSSWQRTNRSTTSKHHVAEDHHSVSSIERELFDAINMPLFINCGTNELLLDDDDNTWEADTYSNTGTQFKYSPCPEVRGNADVDTIFYCTERYFSKPVGSYTIPSIRAGKYLVELYFTESFYTQPNQRRFNVQVQGVTAGNGVIDIFAASGGQNKELKVTVVADVPRPPEGTRFGSINISFLKVKGEAKVNAMIIRQISLLPPLPEEEEGGFTAININSGFDRNFTDLTQILWVADTFFNGASTFSKIAPIVNTTLDRMYQYERSGAAFAYEIPLPVGLYEVQLHFAELVYNNVGDRIFNVVVEKDLTFSNIDIVESVGKSSPYIITFTKLIDDQFLNIEFTRPKVLVTQGLPKISGISLKLAAAHFAHSVTQGPYDGVVLNATKNKALVELNGEASHTHDQGAKLNSTIWRLDSTNKVIGTTLKLKYNFPVGNNSITLSVQDTKGNTDTETTSVLIQPFGVPAVTSIFPASGSFKGGYPIRILGSGFNYTADRLTVQFGLITIKGSANIKVLNSKTLEIICPTSAVTAPAKVTVKSPLGESNSFFFSFTGEPLIKWNAKHLVSYPNPTVARFGPDQRLYVGTVLGRILKITMSPDFRKAVTVIVRKPFDEDKYSILGLAFDPLDTKADPDVYFTAQIFEHRSKLNSNAAATNGRIMKASGPMLETIETVVSGLPISDGDHGLNALEFGNRGELFFNHGSNTNGGIPGAQSFTRQLKENFLSAAINVAYLSHPDFDGAIKWSAPDDGNMIAKGIDVYASGFRNPYGSVMHMNGELYATDNGPNNGFGRMSTGCGENDFILDVQSGDEVNHVIQGMYYGHPNRKRAEVFNQPIQCVYKRDKVLIDNFKPPLITASASRDGIIEFHSNHFNGQLRGNLIFTKFKSTPSLSRIVLNAAGTNVIPESAFALPMDIGSLGLDITQAPNGNIIEVRYDNSSLAVIIPVEPKSTELTIKSVFPRRGRNAGGNVLSIYGINFLRSGKSPTIKVGGIDCPRISATQTRIDCTLPGGRDVVDIVVTNGLERSTFEKGYRYISGLLPINFKIPVYA